MADKTENKPGFVARVKAAVKNFLPQMWQSSSATPRAS